MEDYIRHLNMNSNSKGPKRSISISLSPETIEFLDAIAETVGLDRSKIIEHVLNESRNLLVDLQNDIITAKKLGFKTSGKMRRAIERAAIKRETKKT